MVTPASTALFLFRRPTLKHEGPWVRAFHIAGFDGIDLKPGCPDQVVHLTIGVTAPTDPLPVRCKTARPARNSNFRRQRTWRHDLLLDLPVRRVGESTGRYAR